MISVNRQRRCSGFTLIELVIALMLLGTVTAVMLPLLISVSAQRRAAEQRQFALLLAENQLDDLLAYSWTETTQVKLTEVVAADHSTEEPQGLFLPDLERHVTVTARKAPDARQITLELRWKDRGGNFTTPIRLSAWKFPPGETAP